MTASVIDWKSWELKRDREGYRTYNIQFLLETTDDDDGPLTVMSSGDLPLVGATYGFGNEADTYCWCTPECTVKPVRTSEPNFLWTLDQIFTNKPMKRCNTDTIENPLDEPQKVSGSFLKYNKKLRQDRNGDPITSSSHEYITGIERDAGRPTVTIEQNIASLGLTTFAAMQDTVNDATLWGLAARKIKLDNISWERKLYGTCTYYYTRKFEFSIKYEGFDLVDVVDTGFKVFDIDNITDNATNRANPKNYIVYKTANQGENSPQKILLDGNGNALSNSASPVFLPTIEIYDESDFTTLGIPTSF